jgi:E3 ubiquitin-protein ligase HUWE1
LDRFDHVLDLFNKEYALNQGPQTQPFERRLLEKGDPEDGMPYPNAGAQSQELEALGYSSEGDRELVESIIHFTRVLLEHCGNRSLYASSTHVNDLLHTTSLSLLRLCLQLGLRLAQRYQVARYKNHHPSAQAALLASHYNINLDNMHKIAMPFPKAASGSLSLSQTPSKIRDKGPQASQLNPSDLVAIAKDPITPAVRSEMSSVTLSYYQSPPPTARPLPPVKHLDAPPFDPSDPPARRPSNLGPMRDRPATSDRGNTANDAIPTPVKSREQDTTSPTAPKVIHMLSSKVGSTPAWKLVQEGLGDLPAESRYDFLNRLRVAKAFASPDVDTQQLLEIRLLAIANLAYALSESKFQERIGVPDAEEPRRFHLAQQLCELLQPATTNQRPLALPTETTVIMTLEALTKSRHKVSEVADSLAISVNHGVLYYELRRVIATLDGEEHTDRNARLEEGKWRDAIFDLINSLLQSNVQARYAEKMVNAGIMAILVEALTLRTSRAEQIHERILQFFDSFIHGIHTAFQTLANVKGLDIIADLTAYQVKAALENSQSGKGLPQEFKSKVVDYDIPFYQQSILRQLFKNTVHMFEHNNGGHDRLLRNLIDTPQILGALRNVIENAPVFGSNVWSGAVNIISNFIHNEPTSYQVIGEAGLSKSFLESITNQKVPDDLPSPGEIVPLSETPSIEVDADGEQPVFPNMSGILPVGEVMCDVPTAFGAICLNENGMQLFQASGALAKYFNIFLSPKHVRAMEEEGQTATTIGHSFDELSRHHPRLKDQIMAAVFNMLRRLKELTFIFAKQGHAGVKLWKLEDGQAFVEGGRAALCGPSAVTNQGALSGDAPFLPTQQTQPFRGPVFQDEREPAPALPFLSACFKFLEGFFHNSSMCALFCEESGTELLLDLATSPSNPFDLVAFPLFSKITQVLKTMCDAKAPLVLPSVIKRAQYAVLGLKDLARSESRSSAFSKYTNLSETAESPFTNGLDGTTVVKSLLNTHLLTHVLGKTLAPPPYTLRHGNQNNHLFASLNFTDVYVELIEELHKLHSACLWEYLLLQRDISEQVKVRTEPRPFVMRRIDANGMVELASERSDRVSNGTSNAAGSSTDETVTPSRAAVLELKNTKAIRYLLSQVPMGIEAFFHSLGQAIVTKRNEPQNKQHAIYVAEHLAQAIISELEFRRNEPDEDVLETKYIAQLLTMINRMLLRNSYSMEAFGNKEALTLVMTKFYFAGGFTKLNEYLTRFVQLLVKQQEQDRVEAPVKDAIQAILSFYSQLVRPKCINDASQSSVIANREKLQPDYFQPGQFVVEVRDAILPAISEIWHSKDIEKLSDANMKSVVDILRLILKAEGEERALRRSENASRRVLAHKPVFKLRSEENVARFVDQLGFDRTLSREGLYRCSGNATNAEAYCKMRQKDATAPRFPVPDGASSEDADTNSTSSHRQLDARTQTSVVPVEDRDSIQTEDTQERGTFTMENDGSARLVLSSDNDAMSDDVNFGSLGRLPDEMRERDLTAMADPEEYDVLAGPAAFDALATLGLSRPALQGKDTQQPYVTVDDLDDKRKALRGDLIDRCLDVLSTQPSLTFELADLIQAAVAKAGEGANPRADIGTTLVSSLISLQAEEPNAESGLKIRAYAHLVALILQDRDFFDSTLDELKEYFGNLVQWVKLDSDKKVEDIPYLSTVLLIIERVLSEDEQPIDVEWIPPSPEDPLKPMPVPSEPEPVVSKELRAELFEALLDILPRIGKNTSLALSVCRVLVVLTRTPDLAARLSEKLALKGLFTMIKQLAGSVDDKLQSCFLLILRHMVEDEDTIRQIMHAEIRVLFENHRPGRLYDTTSYTRSMYHLVIRNPKIFVEVTQETLKIANFDGNLSRAQHLTLKPTSADAPIEGQPAIQVPKTAEFKMPSFDQTDGVIQFLLRELINYSNVEDTPVPASKDEQPDKSDVSSTPDVVMSDATPAPTAEAPALRTEAKTDKPAFKPEEHAFFIYRCFILQCLAELVACYNRSKLEFIHFSRKADSQPATPAKPRAGTLNYLLNTLLPVGTLEHQDDVGYRKRAATSNWATNVLVSLCTKSQERQSPNLTSREPGDHSEQEPELTFVRKFVLEHALRAFKDATSSNDPLDQRYSRLLALGELFNRLLNGKVEVQRSNMAAGAWFGVPQQMGRLMYEKNFIGTLTSAIAELDLNFPNAKRAVKYILGPLKQLTELGVTLSQTSSLSSGPNTSADEDDISSATSISELDQDEREQTPNLLGDTSLAGLEGEDDSEDSDDEDEDEMDYDGYDDGMEYGEEEMPEHGDVVSDEDDDDLGEIEGLPGDVDMELDVMMDEEDEESDDTSDDDDEEDDDDQDVDDDGEFGDHMDMEEITGDDDNASLGGHDTGDWEEDGIDFDDHDDMQGAGSPHGGPLEHIGHVLGAEDVSESGDHGHIVRIDMGDGAEEFFDDEMAPEDDDDDDEEEEVDYGEDIVYEPEIEDDEDEEADGGWAWDIQPPSAVLRGGHHHHHHRGGFNEMLGMINDPLRPMGIRSHRSTPNARDEDGVNPLLQRESGLAGSSRDRDPLDAGAPRLSASRRNILPGRGEAFLQDIVAAVGPNAPGVINVNVGEGQPGFGALPPMFHFQTRNGAHAMIDIDPTRPWREQLVGGPDPRRWAEVLPGSRMNERSGQEEAQAVEFRPLQTLNRWQEEARLLFPGKFHEKALRVVNMLFRALIPEAMEAKRISEKKEAERRAAAEKEAEEARKKLEAERAEREAQEKKEREEREALERAETEARERDQAGSSTEDGDMEGIEQDDEAPAADEQTQATEPEQPSERVTISIRGQELDITSLGIDREYIEALPEDMREEVVMAQFAEQRSQAVQAGEQHSEISREFLEALPRDIQQELLRSEQMDRRRREREEERQRRRNQEGSAPAAQPEEMNNADFMAMLDPALRQAVLRDADDSVLAALPEELQAEARALFGDRRQPAAIARISRGLEAAGARILNGQAAGQPVDAATREPSRQRRPVAQMLDKAGIATLLRLMFISLNHKAKTNLHGILSDVCKNTQNRAEVISILLSILQDGTADVNAVERSFAQLSLRAKQPAGPKTPQPLKRTLTGQQGMTPSTDLSPLNIVQQCLGTLNALANDNPRVPSFFLNEHETITSQSTKSAKKGKSRESKAAKFPLNALLTLLDRKLITENTAVMETLASLLSHVTHPLTILLRRAKETQLASKSDADKPPESDQPPSAQVDDISMQESTAEPSASNTDPATTESAAPKEKEEEGTDTASKKKHRDLTPPEVPEENMGLVVNILAARECPSKTFSDTLDIIKNLSAIPGAKEVFGRELIRQAQELGQTLLEDLGELSTQINAAQTGTDLQGMALASFSSPGSKQRKLLRVLVALDHLFDPKRTPLAPATTGEGGEQKLKEDILATLYESSTFDKLWESLSICLTAIRQRGNMVNVATILLPLIESLMVVCRNSALKDLPVATVTSPTDTTGGTPPPDARMENLFFNFTEEHRKILNELIRNNPKLMNGNLAVLAKNSKVLEFDNKRSYFSRKLHDRRSEVRVAHPSLQLSVRRDQVFLDSFKSLYYKTGNEIKYGKLNIRFHNEEGIDAGGVSREWFAAMARQMFNPDYALFNPVAADRTTFHPNTLSEVNPEHLLFFKFIGRIIGKALYENRVLDCHFSRAVYRKILGKSVSLKDMETLDLDYYKSLVWILENDITDVTFETFSVDVDRFGVTETIDLIPNGRNIPVTEENKHEFVRHVVDYRLIRSVEKQLDEFLAGFHEIIPSELVSIFNEQELELLISGLPDIDVDDWKNNTDYHNYTPTSPQVQWFWRAVRSFDKEEKAKLLQFVTGTSKVPLNGFKELEGMNGFSKFNIHRDYSNKAKLPSSHTCFNRKPPPHLIVACDHC